MSVSTINIDHNNVKAAMLCNSSELEKLNQTRSEQQVALNALRENTLVLLLMIDDLEQVASEDQNSGLLQDFICAYRDMEDLIGQIDDLEKLISCHINLLKSTGRLREKRVINIQGEMDMNTSLSKNIVKLREVGLAKCQNRYRNTLKHVYELAQGELGWEDELSRYNLKSQAVC